MLRPIALASLVGLLTLALPTGAADHVCPVPSVYSDYCWGIHEYDDRPHNAECTADETTLHLGGATLTGFRFDCGAQRYSAVMLSGFVFYNEGGPANAPAPTRCWIDLFAPGGYQSYDVPCPPTGAWTDPGWGGVAP